MIKRTIDISDGPTHLSIKDAQLLLSRDRAVIASIPAEDVGVLLVDHHSTTYTHAVFTTLAERGACVIVCAANHLPTAVVLPVSDNDLSPRRTRTQAACARPLRKRLWKQIVRRKVKLQAMNLPGGHPVRARLLQMATEVKSGDTSNVEGQAARFYWPALLGEDFRRDPDGEPPNGLLNYGYMVLRASVARAIVAAGLHPSFGLQHAHRNNVFALADDLVEVLRPMVDRTVNELRDAGADGGIDRDAKRKLLGLLAEEVKVGDQRGPLMVQLHRVAASLVHCYEGEADRLELPVYPVRPSRSGEAPT